MGRSGYGTEWVWDGVGVGRSGVWDGVGVRWNVCVEWSVWNGVVWNGVVWDGVRVGQGVGVDGGRV